VVTKDGHAGAHALAAVLALREAAHPLPDARSAAAAEAALAVAAGVPATDQLLVLISGGASALLCAPAAGLDMQDKLRTVAALAAAGADIATLNVVRRHLSRIKGGRLAAACAAPVLALAWSDVLGDDTATIGGGPAAADATTFRDALAALDRFGLRAHVPAAARQHLEQGASAAAGAPGETVKPGDRRLDALRTRVLAGPDDLAAAAAAALREHGAVVEHVETGVHDAVDSLAGRLAARAQALAWRVAAGECLAMVAGGEPVVTLPASPGQGGRAQHTALDVARRLAEMRWPPGVEVTVLCGASDGSDGPTGDAGGIVTPGTWAAIEAAGVDAAAALRGFDAGPALAAGGALLHTGPTGQNLCDLFLVVAKR
jgi:hydroxypyruvate reductase